MTFDGPAFIRHVAERLIQEFQFSQGAGTPSLVGAAKEHPARVQLQRLMPGGVGVGSGIVVDSYGGVSRQQDIVIYEELCPVFTHNDAPEATYYPVEGVIAAGEVKSGFGKTELKDAVAKSASVKILRRRAEATADGIGPPLSHTEITAAPLVSPQLREDSSSKTQNHWIKYSASRFASGSRAALKPHSQISPTNVAVLAQL